MSVDDQIRETVDHLFRHQAGQMVSILVRIFGVQYIETIEDAVQEAMIAALRKWPYGGVPANQIAWLTQVAKNRVFDQLRRNNKSTNIEDVELETSKRPDIRFERELNEDQLRMIFACCHPATAADSQVALTLKLIGGFSVGEIAQAYLAKEEAIAKMLTRAKQKLRTASLEIPAGQELRERLDAVLRVLYLMFNEGYTATEGEALIRRDLCDEAIRLIRIVIAHPDTAGPKVHALAALFFFQAARFATRSDVDGNILLLADQDRSKWDKGMMAAGLEHFRRSAAGDELSAYHIEAEIASIHTLAPDLDRTNWRRIIECYDQLLKQRFSPIVALNRAVAIGQANDPNAALDELSKLAGNYLMTSFYLFHSTKAHFLAANGETERAIAAYEKAAELTRNEPARRFLQSRIEMLTSSK